MQVDWCLGPAAHYDPCKNAIENVSQTCPFIFTNSLLVNDKGSMCWRGFISFLRPVIVVFSTERRNDIDNDYDKDKDEVIVALSCHT